MILLHHYGLFSDKNIGILNLFQKTSGLFSAGVDIFFVLSGFFIGGILVEKKAADNFYAIFYLKRIARILPAYLALVLSYFFVSSGRLSSAEFYPASFLKCGCPMPLYLLFAQNLFISLTSVFDPVYMLPAWALALEVQFYLLIPMMMRKLSSHQLILISVSAVLTAPLIRFMLISVNPFHFQKPWWAAYVLFPSRMDSFFLGILTVYLVKNPRLHGVINKNFNYLYWSGTVCLVIFCFLTVFKQTLLNSVISTLGYTLFAFTGTLIILILIYGKPGRISRFFSSPVFQQWGKLSYFMYLFHVPYFAFAQSLVFKTRTPIINSLPTFFCARISFLFLWFTAYLFRYFVELPISRISGQLKYRGKGLQTA